MACTWALTNVHEQSHIMILSDSQAAIMAINSANTHSRVVLDITNSTHQVPNKLELGWVPDHTGVPGSERVDELARRGNRAIQKEFLNYLHSLLVSQCGRLPLSSKGNFPLTFLFKIYRYTLGNLKREHRRWITWLLTGHSPLAYFQHTAKNFPSPYCEHCPGEKETSEHSLGQRVRYMTLRLHTFGKLTISMEDIQYIKLSIIIDFISKSKRFEREDLFG